MEEIELTELTDQELLDERKELKSFSILNAFFIGFFSWDYFFQCLL